MADSLQTVRDAKAQLLEKLHGKRWLRGVGISRSPQGPKVRVNVSELDDEVRAAVPAAVGDVQVELVVVGEITAWPSSEHAVGSPDPDPMPEPRVSLKSQ